MRRAGHPARGLAVAALFLVVFQGVLGGMTVKMQLPDAVSTAHLATSMVFLETWRQRDRVQVAGGASLLPWLLGVANNVLRRHRRVAFRHRNALARLHVAVAQPDHADLVAQRRWDPDPGHPRTPAQNST